MISPAPLPRPQWPAFVVGLAVLACALAMVSLAAGWRLGALLGVGVGLGFALAFGRFGFTAAWRDLLSEGRSAPVRGQLLMLAVTVTLFYPALASGSLLGAPVRGFVFPAGFEVAIGAFLFGIGMQLGGGCASGVLTSTGSGDLRSAITLVFFVVGMTVGAWDAGRWADLPALPSISLLNAFGAVPAWGLTLAAFAAIAWVLIRREARLTGRVESLLRRQGSHPLSRLSPLVWAALAFAVLNAATLYLAGRPWGLTQAFATWGARVAESAGIADPVFWPYWEDPTRIDLLHRPLIQDATHLMNLGLVLGAFLAVALGGRLSLGWRIPPGPLLAAILGGLLLGYGARMAFGCNISAYVSGIASGSLHGWLWIAAALPGTWVGLRIRPLFGLGIAPQASQPR